MRTYGLNFFIFGFIFGLFLILAGCGDSSGSTGATGSTSVTTGGSGGGDAPTILNFSTNVMTLSPGDPLIVSAVVTHPQGIMQIVGGTLADPSGASYGTFQVSTGQGAWSITVPWGEIEQVADVTTGPQGTTRMFVAQFFDQAGHTTSRSLSINIVCAGGKSICAGACADLATDESHCGTCEKNCLQLGESLPPNIGTYGKSCIHGSCEIVIDGSARSSCDSVCSKFSLACVDDPTYDSYDCGPQKVAGSCASAPSCGTQPPPSGQLFCVCG
jgi:hypothetical protein